MLQKSKIMRTRRENEEQWRLIDQTTLRVALEAVDPGLRRDEVLAASGLPIVVPAKAGTQRLLLNVGKFGLN